MTGKKSSVTIIDASGLILGRLASTVAKKLLTGETVIIVNAEKAVVSGSREGVARGARKRLETRTHTALSKAPKHPRRPDRIMRVAVRGMLPWRKPHGIAAYKRLKVYVGVLEDFKKVEAKTIPQASSVKLKGPFVTLEKLARYIGWIPMGER